MSGDDPLVSLSESEEEELEQAEQWLATTPYRTPEVMPAKQKYGLILAPPPKKPHRCNPPGMLKLFWMWITRRPCRQGSLFRCRCGQVHLRGSEYGTRRRAWSSTYLTVWEDKGGEL